MASFAYKLSIMMSHLFTPVNSKSGQVDRVILAADLKHSPINWWGVMDW